MFCSVLHLPNVEQLQTIANWLLCSVLHLANAIQCKTLCRALYSLTFQILQLNACSITRARLCAAVLRCVACRWISLWRNVTIAQCDVTTYTLYIDTHKQGERQWTQHMYITRSKWTAANQNTALGFARTPSVELTAHCRSLLIVSVLTPWVDLSLAPNLSETRCATDLGLARNGMNLAGNTVDRIC